MERGPRQVTVELGQDLDLYGIFEPAVDFKLNQEVQKAVAQAKEFVAEALKSD